MCTTSLVLRPKDALNNIRISFFFSKNAGAINWCKHCKNEAMKSTAFTLSVYTAIDTCTSPIFLPSDC